MQIPLFLVSVKYSKNILGDFSISPVTASSKLSFSHRHSIYLQLSDFQRLSRQRGQVTALPLRTFNIKVPKYQSNAQGDMFQQTRQTKNSKVEIKVKSVNKVCSDLKIVSRMFSIYKVSSQPNQNSKPKQL